MFPGFTTADFDCYEPRKWQSNIYNRERMEIKQKLLGLAKDASGALAPRDGLPLFIETSVEHPALWNHKQVDSQSVFFSRNIAARKELDGIIDRQKPISSLLDDPTPQRNHVFLAITLNHEGLELSLKLHPDATVDRQTLERKLEDHFECERLVDLLRDLPAGFCIGVTPERHLLADPAAPIDVARLRAIIQKLPPGSGTAPAGILSGPLPGQGPMARLFYVGRTLSRAEVVGSESLLVWAQQNLALLLPIYQFIAWSRENDFVSMRKVLDKERTTKRQKGLGKNDAVRINKGVLIGKTGIVQDVDAKGQMKVLVGKMIIKIDATDVEKP